MVNDIEMVGLNDNVNESMIIRSKCLLIIIVSLRMNQNEMVLKWKRKHRLGYNKRSQRQ